jgi:BirA family biotin operon repressor/biotin-[acetyl-CoA-carboxylase] ligase
MQASLFTNTFFVGKVAYHLPSVDSTNTYLWELVSKTNPTEGTAVWADTQTAGRGQIGSRWESKAGENLTVSFLFIPRFVQVQAQFVLNQIASLAVRDTLLLYGLAPELVRIKWANDVYVGHKKIAGILIENVLQAPQLKYTVIGIGLNINQLEFSPDLSKATSLQIETRVPQLVEHVLSDLCLCLERRYLQLRAGKYTTILADYLACLYQYQTLATYFIPSQNRQIVGKIVGISDIGKLIIATETETLYFAIKEIQFL